MKPVSSFILLFVAGWLHGQDTLPTGKIEVIKDFEVRLTETKKIRIVPQPIVLDTAARHYTYDLSAPSPQINYLTPEIKPLAIDPEQKPTYYSLFGKVGYGSPNSALGSLSFSRQGNNGFNWGIDGDYLGANNKKIPLQKFSEAHARLQGSYQLANEVVVDAFLDGEWEKHYFYGAEDIPTDPDVLKRNFQRYAASVGFSRSMRPPGDHTWFVGRLSYTSDQDNFGSREQGVEVMGSFNSALGANDYPLGMEATIDFSNLKHIESHKVNNIILSPYFIYRLGDVQFQAGTRVLLKSHDNEILPNLELQYQPEGSTWKTFLAWKGNLHKNNFQTLSMLNPYITTRLDSLNNEVWRTISGGIRGWKGSLAYELTGVYQKFTGKAFYLQEVTRKEQFKPIYDNGYYYGVEGYLSIHLWQRIAMRTDMFARVYKLENENKPWHVPSAGIYVSLMYPYFQDDVKITLTFNGENGLPYRTVGGTEARLEALLDLSLHADYYITSSLGAFAEINNILGNNRERWYKYPGFGFNAKAGILFRLPE